MKRIAITGSSGYLGSCLRRHLAQWEPAAEVLGIDVVAPRDPSGHEFLCLDMESPELTARLRAFQPDTLVHMGFVVKPMHDERRMREINVAGSRNVLAAAAAAGVRRLLVTSSTTVFGAHPDNPVPIDDDWTGRAGSEFRYAADKVEVEAMLGRFAVAYPEVRVSCVRPCIVCGPHMENYLQRHLFGMPLILLLGGKNSRIQFVHEDDVSAAIYEVLLRDGVGAYNLAPPDACTLSELAEATGRRWLKVPFWLGWFMAWLAWHARFPPHEYPPGFLEFVRYPWLAAPRRLRDELGFQFRYSSRQTLQIMADGKRNGAVGSRTAAPEATAAR